MSNINIFRPFKFDEFIGNEKIISQLKVFIYSAKKLNKSLDHILLYGPPGIGKTSLAKVIANEMNTKIITINGNNLVKLSDLITVLSSLNKFDILFIDEIHCIDKNIVETLYSVMEDFKIPINYQDNDNNKIIEVDVEPFTLIGATTDISKISKPLFDRFGIKYKINPYTENELIKIIEINANKLNLELNLEASNEIAIRSKNIPRIGLNYLKRVHDFAIYKNIKKVDKDFIINIFNLLEIDKYGLTKDDYKIIKILYENYHNKPVSLKSIAILLNDSPSNIEYLNEPYLISLNIIERTKQGRKLTKYGINLYKKLFLKDSFNQYK